MNMGIHPFFAIFFAAVFPVNVLADSYSIPKNQVVEDECGSCHMVYPPKMLNINSWRRIMSNLPSHFGADASLDEKRQFSIMHYLSAYAGRQCNGSVIDTQNSPLPRVTKTAMFIRKHGDVSPKTWNRPSVRSPANCPACHVNAASGDFEEHDIRIPK